MSPFSSQRRLGVSTSQLQDSAAFNQAAYGFTVFALVLPLAVLVYGIVVTVISSYITTRPEGNGKGGRSVKTDAVHDPHNRCF